MQVEWSVSLWTNNYTSEDRDRHCEMMKKSDGWDHFITMGRITWDFRRSSEQDWGSRCIYLPGMRNITRLLIECNSWDYFDVGVPYPTGFHPNSPSDVATWQEFVRTRVARIASISVLVDGDWLDSPSRVKAEFYIHFAKRFSTPDWTRAPFDAQFPRRLDVNQACDLECEVTNEEIKRAVWDCGSDKSLGPDGFTFEFFKKYWSTVGVDVINAIKEFFSSSNFPNGCNSSFIALIPKVQEQSAFIKGRQIMDGPLILNKVISWCKSKKVQALLFKVDFQKAFDSVRWDHIDDILYKLGFGFK
ncbi:RNA-directed DNA polymerase, eukaryota [Tanacetum coccineum]